MMREVAAVDRDVVERFLCALFDSAPASGLIELRFRIGAGMGRSFHAASALDELGARITARARRRDVFVGVVPRARRGGGRRDLVEQASVVWADCDGPAAVEALGRFAPAPSMIVASGSGPNCHAYWLLSQPVGLEMIEQFNRRLALALGADVRSCDGARILRPAGSANSKSRPPTPVRLVALENAEQVDIADLDERLPELTVGERGPKEGRRRDIREVGGDPLLRISPRVYVERLTGQKVGRDGKLRCPFHDDGTPSLHVYPTPERGWFCFGCRRGGSIYDLAAELWRVEPRGAAFREVRDRLTRMFSSPSS